MTMDERVEAAARAMWPRKMKDREYETERERYTHACQRLACRMLVELGFRAAFPELHGDKTHWLAPMEATEEMLGACTGLSSWEGVSEVRAEYELMRDAYLGKGDGE